MNRTLNHTESEKDTQQLGVMSSWVVQYGDFFGELLSARIS